MPSSAPLPVPTRMAVGVASPNAQGQAMISTATKLRSAKTMAGAGPHRSQTANVSSETPITAGTKTAATWSASRWMGALEPCASSTSRTICASTVSRPTRVARMVKLPVLLSVAPKTESPAALSTGRLSPVSIDSSSVEWPSVMAPSTGTFSPGRTSTRSPMATSCTGMSTVSPSRHTRAVLACRPMSLRMASEVWPRARASSRRPRTIKARIMTAVSK